MSVLLYSAPIGVIDSGLGGISVLRELRRLMPKENYIYFADKENAPYGSKSPEAIKELTMQNISFLRRYGCKAVAIACNTATAVAVDSVRKRWDIPIVGLEPALKPAVKRYSGRDILVLATPVTLNQNKFRNLLEKYSCENIYCIAAPEIVRFVERGELEGIKIIGYLKDLLSGYSDVRFSACVLGCTHFPFVKNAICEALGYSPCFFDGGTGAAHRLESLLKREKNLNLCEQAGMVLWNTMYPHNLNRRLLYSK